MTRRRFELINLLADEEKPDFDFNLNELAPEHLRLSQKITAESGRPLSRARRPGLFSLLSEVRYISKETAPRQPRHCA